MKHEGAASSTATYFRTARCIYSGNERMYDLPSKYWSDAKQEKLNNRFMNEECDCSSCTERRKERKKLRMALEREGCKRELELLGMV